MRTDLPAGTVTFLFTDVEGSTRLLHELGPEGYAQALAEHRRVVREAFRRHGGVEVDTQGDAFFVAFPTAPGALAAAAEAREALAAGPIHVRMGIHTGTPLVTQEGYVGADVHRAARIAAAGHGGQVLVSRATASLVEQDGLVDLGEHRLKDLSAPERIYQLGAREFPPLASLHRTNLPVPATPFLGRERELEEIGELLARADVRLVTLTGPGGTGKTRLALQAAGAAAEAFPGGVFWVPLAPLRDPALVLDTAAGALGGQGELQEQIADRRLLLLFDNFEHLLDAAAELGELRRACPGLTLLVTSRAPLRLEGEWEYAVEPLAMPEAVALFETRARAVKRDFAADGEVREICARLDNLPLAIELAAARVKVLSPGALLERLERRLPLLAGGARDLPERQRTLRATIEWSHELLSGEEQLLFRRLGVFRGGCTLDAAEAVCEADLDTLASLVDKSLVRVRDEERYWLLETIREYAEERLEASGEEEALRGRHADYFVALAEELEPEVSEYAREALVRLEHEHDNLRAALDWLETAGDTARTLQLAGALAEFWGIKGHIAEARRRLERALRADGRATAARARALSRAADLSDERETSRRWAEEALTLYRALGDQSGEAWSLVVLGDVAGSQGDWPEARERWAASMQLFREAGDLHNALFATRLYAWAQAELGELERSRELYEAALEEARLAGLRHMQAQLLEGLAHLVVDRSGIDEALRMTEQAYRIHVEIGDVFRIAVSVCRFARLLAVAGRQEDAARTLGSGERLLDEIGGAPPWVAEMNSETLESLRLQLDATALDAAKADGAALGVEDAVAFALAALSVPTDEITGDP